MHITAIDDHNHINYTRRKQQKSGKSIRIKVFRYAISTTAQPQQRSSPRPKKSPVSRLLSLSCFPIPSSFPELETARYLHDNEMDASTIIAIGIIFMLLCIFGTLAGLLVYLGIFREILVNVGKPPLRKFRGFYKFARGDYKDSGSIFESINKLAPELRTFGVYYDDPSKTLPNHRRYIVGAIAEEDGVPCVEDQGRLKELEEALKSSGFKETDFPEVSAAVFADFPWRTGFSVYIAINRVYSALKAFIKEKSLEAGPFIELYDKPNELISFIAPLDKQDEFFVLECLETNDDEDFENLSPESGNDEEDDRNDGGEHSAREESAQEEEEEE
ncbi:putative Testis-expressed sequence 264 protein [Hypsibius exemplaris]|uniref:Testis-expressed sequence 264 protein n=1 Tax=Hypsibius exemplaris TaxID=2072580 RepID=A0A1W0X6N2_HYPEX|nr:putative Testis-expressed sequence 264 protein [Hypsibius exemplaris]